MAAAAVFGDFHILEIGLEVGQRHVDFDMGELQFLLEQAGDADVLVARRRPRAHRDREVRFVSLGQQLEQDVAGIAAAADGHGEGIGRGAAPCERLPEEVSVLLDRFIEGLRDVRPRRGVERTSGQRQLSLPPDECAAGGQGAHLFEGGVLAEEKAETEKNGECGVIERFRETPVEYMMYGWGKTDFPAMTGIEQRMDAVAVVAYGQGLAVPVPGDEDAVGDAIPARRQAMPEQTVCGAFDGGFPPANRAANQVARARRACRARVVS